VLVAASTADVADTIHTLRGLTLLAALLSAAIGGAAVALLMRGALRPLVRLDRAAAEIGRSGDARRRLPDPHRHDEVGRLATTLNTMLEGLERARDAERRFLADASHELRTPLTIMRGNLELVARDPNMAPEDRVAALRDAIEEAERMSRLVDDLLALARVDAGMALPDTDIELGRLVRDVADGARPVAGARLISVTIGSDGTRVRGSEPLIRRLLENLTDNAIKYTSPTGSISISLAEEGPDAILTVADDGIGMSPEDLRHAFDRFWRSDWSRERPGSGLGLSIAKAVAEAHGGGIDATSEPGAGSTFTVRLPVLPEDAPSREAPVPATI